MKKAPKWCSFTYWERDNCECERSKSIGKSFKSPNWLVGVGKEINVNFK